MPDSPPAPKDYLDYPCLFNTALRGLVRSVLSRVADEGLPGAHHFFLTFRTDVPGVRLPADVRARFPDAITVVLQHQFWDLDVTPDTLTVTLSFGGTRAAVTFPWEALIAFSDPSVGVEFAMLTAARSDAAPAEDDGSGAALPPEAPSPADNVVPLRARRPQKP